MSRPCQTLHLVRLYHAQPHDWLTGSALATRGHMPATTHAHDHPFVMQHGRPATQSAASHHVFIPSCTACVLQGRLFTRTPHRTLVLHSNNPPPPPLSCGYSCELSYILHGRKLLEQYCTDLPPVHSCMWAADMVNAGQPGRNNNKKNPSHRDNFAPCFIALRRAAPTPRHGSSSIHMGS